MNYDTCDWTNYHVGKKGVMVNRETGLRIHGTVNRVTLSRSEIGFQIDGTTYNNAFRWSAWFFEPDPEPIKDRGQATRDRFAKVEVGEHFQMTLDGNGWRHNDLVFVKIDDHRFIQVAPWTGAPAQSISHFRSLWKFRTVAQ